MRYKEAFLELSNRCNLHCKHCYTTYFNKAGLDCKSIFLLLKSLRKNGIRKIRISGGEPFVEKEIFTVLKEIRRQNFLLTSISTNATLINKNLAKKIKIYLGKKGKVFVSLDGISKSSHEKLRRENTFERALQGLKELDRNKCSIAINTVVHRYNIKELPLMYEYLKQFLSINEWRLGTAKPLGEYLKYYPDFEINFWDVLRTYTTILEKWIFDKQKQIRKIDFSDFFKTDIFKYGFASQKSIDHPCSYNFQRLNILPTGKVIFCDLLPYITFGKAFGTDIKTISKNASMHPFIHLKIKDIKECLGCRYYQICGSGCRANSMSLFGDLWHRDLYACAGMIQLEKISTKIFPKDLKSQFENFLDKQGWIPQVPTKLSLLNFKSYGNNTKIFSKKIREKVAKILGRE